MNDFKNGKDFEVLTGLQAYLHDFDLTLDRLAMLCKEIKDDFKEHQKAWNASFKGKPSKMSNIEMNIRRKENTLSVEWATYDKSNTKERREKGNTPHTSPIKKENEFRYTRRELKKEVPSWQFEKVWECEEKLIPIRKAKGKIGDMRKSVKALNRWLEANDFSIHPTDKDSTED